MPLKFLRSARYAAEGIKNAWLGGRNFRIQCGIAFLVVCTCFFAGLTNGEWAIILLCTGIVLGAEIVNTAIEHLTDILFPGYHEKAKLIKDLSAAAVLLLSFFSACVGLLILLPKVPDF